MANLSPKVTSREIDLSEYVAGVSTSTGAIAGYSKKGTLDLKLITSRSDFITEYGEPEVGNYFHYSALAFLENGNSLYVKRCVPDDIAYAGIAVTTAGFNTFAVGSRVLSASLVDYSTLSDALNMDTSEDELFFIMAKDPGTWGNNIAVKIRSVLGADNELTTGTISVADSYTFVIEVYYKDADGNVNLMESWKVSRKNKLDGYGKQLFLTEVINGYSDYIYVLDRGTTDTDLPDADDSTAEAVTYLTEGYDGGDIDVSDIVGVNGSGWDAFSNKDDVKVQILIGGCFNSTTNTASDISAINDKLVTICTTRRDCFAILDMPLSEVGSTENMIIFRETTDNQNTSFAAYYAPWVKVNDAYNDRIVQLPPSGYVASQYAYTDAVGNVWDAPAGERRGVLNVLGLTKVFTEGERDTIYPKGINPIQMFRGQGTMIFGIKTSQYRSSALQDVPVRRSVTAIEQALETSLRSFLFEPNNELTRFRITALVDEYLDNLSSRGAFQTEGNDKGYFVRCDETNNTPAVIDSGECRVDVFIKPVRAIQYITINTIITKSGVSFQELVSKGKLF